MGYWIKLYTEFNNDPKIGLLSHDAQLLAVKLFLMAGELDQSGELPTAKKIAWILREPVEWVETSLNELVHAEILDLREDGTYRVINFEKRQARVDDATRQREKRKSGQLHSRDEAEQHIDEDVTEQSRDCHADVTTLSHENKTRDVERKKERETEKKEKIDKKEDVISPIPITKDQAHAWNMATGDLRGSGMGKADFDTYIKPLELVSVEGTRFTVRAGNRYARDWVMARCASSLVNYLTAQSGGPAKLEVIC